jgi:hypothetical protein
MIIEMKIERRRRRRSYISIKEKLRRKTKIMISVDLIKHLMNRDVL